YKIHIPGSPSFVGSNSSHSSGDLYTLDRRFNLSKFAQLRNKRMVDVVLASGFLLLWPVLAFFVQKPAGFLGNCIKVLAGSCTWVGYTPHQQVNQYLPKIRRGVIPPYYILKDYDPADEVKEKMNL